MKMEEPSPARMPEMLSDRFGNLEAVANSSIELSRYVSACADELSRDVQVNLKVMLAEVAGAGYTG